MGSYPCISEACLEVTYVVFLLCYVVLNALIMPMTMMLSLMLIIYVIISYDYGICLMLTNASYM